MNFFKTISIYTIIITVTVISVAYYGLNSTLGAKIVLTGLNRAYLHKYSKNLNLNLNKLTGNFIKGLNFSEINYHDDNYDIEINNLKLKLNLIDYAFKKKLQININQLSGTLNQQPISGTINLEFYNKYITLCGKNFIKIGDNLFKLSNDKEYIESKFKKIQFIIDIKEIALFVPQASGNLKINSEISNKLDYIIVNKIITSKLLINNKNLAGLFNPHDNHLKAKFLFNPKPIVTIDLSFKDLNSIMDFIPELARLKGRLEGTTSINFNSHTPKITTNLSFKDITVTLPTYGIKIKPLNINFTADNAKFINIDAKGVMRDGPGIFEVHGKIKPFDTDNPLALSITSNTLEFINTPEYHLIGKLNLQLLLTTPDKLNVTGELNISKGLINLEKQHSKIVKSKDIVFINQNIDLNPNNDTGNYIVTSRTTSNDIKIFPDIGLRIEEETFLKGVDFNANITGKLKIYTLNEDHEHWLGNGRITIKQGTYILSNQKFLIDKGRMIYLPGTLINNPILDIKVSANKEHVAYKSSEKYLYIEGTLNKPIIKDVGLIDENQAILQILNLGNNPITGGLKEKLHLSELGIQDNDYETSKEFRDLNEEQSFLDNKNFVVGKKISKKVDLKYFKTLNTPNNTVKLKYNFNRHFAFEIESSTVDGYGTDFYFYKEIQ